MKKFAFRFTFLIIIITIVIFLFKPLFLNLNYGLDLQGGFEVLYQVSPLDGNEVTKDMLTSTYKTISRRIDVLGVSEPEILVEGNSRIRVKLAGVTNQETARKMISTTASLSFRDSSDNLLMTSEVLSGAKLDFDPETKKPVVALSIKDNDKFYEITKRISETEDKLIVIWLDFEEEKNSYKSETNCGSLSSSKCLSAAGVSQGFAGNVVIQGNFSQDEASDLADLINSGSIPTKLDEISSKTVGASFGENSLNKTLTAGIVGVVSIVVFLIIIYSFAGFISSVGIILYAFITFLIFYLIGGVLTLPGIAALVLGIGMAVDANVINFESLKDELKRTKNLKEAFINAHKRSFLTIIDANITTFIVAIILFVFGESSVKGFATMLMINIFVTLIVIVFLVKYLLKVFINTKFFDKKLNLFVFNRKTNKHNFDIMKQRKKVWLISILIIIIGFVFIFTKGLNLGIDYKGGSNITVVSKNIINSNEISKDIKNLKYEISDIDNIDKNTVYLKFDSELDNIQTEEISYFLENKYDANIDIGVVSDLVKKDLTKNAIYSVVFSLIGILIYVSIRFKFTFAKSAVIALLHDAFVVIAVFSILRLEVNAIFVAAILTIIGYSINDTIVIFDKIRENIKKLKTKNIKTEKEVYELINISLNETMKRTIYTSLTTILVVLSLILLGSYEIINFNIALLIGLITGTYSTIFIASTIWYELEIRELKKTKQEKPKIKELDEAIIKGINS